MTEPLIELTNVDVALNGTTVLHGINWQLHAGEQWAEPAWHDEQLGPLQERAQLRATTAIHQV